MKLFDFVSRKKADAPVVKKPVVPDVDSQGHVSVTPEELVESDNWKFRGTRTGTADSYDHKDIIAAAAIYQAQQIARIAEDIEAIRKHLTRLTLVESADRETP